MSAGANGYWPARWSASDSEPCPSARSHSAPSWTVVGWSSSTAMIGRSHLNAGRSTPHVASTSPGTCATSSAPTSSTASALRVSSADSNGVRPSSKHSSAMRRSCAFIAGRSGDRRRASICSTARFTSRAADNNRLRRPSPGIPETTTMARRARIALTTSATAGPPIASSPIGGVNSGPAAKVPNDGSTPRSPWSSASTRPDNAQVWRCS